MDVLDLKLFKYVKCIKEHKHFENVDFEDHGLIKLNEFEFMLIQLKYCFIIKIDIITIFKIVDDFQISCINFFKFFFKI